MLNIPINRIRLEFSCLLISYLDCWTRSEDFDDQTCCLGSGFQGAFVDLAKSKKEEHNHSVCEGFQQWLLFMVFKKHNNYDKMVFSAIFTKRVAIHNIKTEGLV